MTLAWLMSGKVGRSMSPFGVRVIHLLILSTLFVTLFFVIPTLIFCQIEYSWDILDAFYFVFISLTTIGLGDYIPGDQENQVLPDVYKASVAGKTLIFGAKIQNQLRFDCEMCFENISSN